MYGWGARLGTGRFVSDSQWGPCINLTGVDGIISSENADGDGGRVSSDNCFFKKKLNLNILFYIILMKLIEHVLWLDEYRNIKFTCQTWSSFTSDSSHSLVSVSTFSSDSVCRIQVWHSNSKLFLASQVWYSNNTLNQYKWFQQSQQAWQGTITILMHALALGGLEWISVMFDFFSI